MGFTKAELRRFDRSFFDRSAVPVARDLVGAYLHYVTEAGHLIGKIVETEAYCQDDAACHASRGETPRNRVMFFPGGYAYIYFTYGMHWCFNVSANLAGIGEAALIRAIEPLAGENIMLANRPKILKLIDALNGPAKFTKAFGLDKSQNGIDLVTSELLYLTKGKRVPDENISITSRVGISSAVDNPWRFFETGNAFVSKGKPSSLS